LAEELLGRSEEIEREAQPRGELGRLFRHAS
jgi:hypothetical protein